MVSGFDGLRRLRSLDQDLLSDESRHVLHMMFSPSSVYVTIIIKDTLLRSHIRR